MGKKLLRQLGWELATQDGDGFVKESLPYLRLLWPSIVETPRLKHLDRKGIDLLDFSETPFPIVVQAKGFKCREDELSQSQINQCIGSINDFLKGGESADQYWLLCNRGKQSEQFGKEVGAALETLVTSGRVRKAERLDTFELVRRASKSLSKQIREQIVAANQIAELIPKNGFQSWITEVPIRISTLEIDQHRLRTSASSVTVVEDPVKAIADSGKVHYVVVIGEFGFGKTTVVLRSIVQRTSEALYMPAARIPRILYKASMLTSFLNPNHFLVEADPHDRSVLERLWETSACKAVETTPGIVLFVDGLDECVTATQRGGLQRIFNSLRLEKANVVFTSRTEFWNSQEAEFRKSFGVLASVGLPQNWLVRRQVRLIELLPWDDTQIALLIERRLANTAMPSGHSNLADLLELVRLGGYSKYYGDIPKRPLFLQFIIDCVESNGVSESGRSQLIEEWVQMKIERDFDAPRALGGEGRIAIQNEDETLDRTLQLAFRSMIVAASIMTEVVDGELQLLPDCSYLKLAETCPGLTPEVPPLGLSLNSLLLLAPRTRPSDEDRFYFAHRAFQEYFLALFIVRNPGRYANAAIPSEVEEWISDIKAAT